MTKHALAHFLSQIWQPQHFGNGKLLYLFEDYALDTDRRELRRGSGLLSVEPKVFDLLVHLIGNRERVISKDDLIGAVWNGRIVSESTLTSCINAARSAIGDSGEAQRLIKTLPRKGVRFVATVREEKTADLTPPHLPAESPRPALTLPDKPSVAVLVDGCGEGRLSVAERCWQCFRMGSNGPIKEGATQDLTGDGETREQFLAHTDGVYESFL